MKHPIESKAWLFSFVELAFLLLIFVMVAQRHSAENLCTINIPLPKSAQNNIAETLSYESISQGKGGNYIIRVVADNAAPFVITAGEKEERLNLKQLKLNINGMLPKNKESALYIFPEKTATVQDLVDVYQLVHRQCAAIKCEGEKLLIMGKGADRLK